MGVTQKQAQEVGVGAWLCSRSALQVRNTELSKFSLPAETANHICPLLYCTVKRKSPAAEGDTIFIFQGWLICKCLWILNLQERTSVSLLTEWVEMRATYREVSSSIFHWILPVFHGLKTITKSNFLHILHTGENMSYLDPIWDGIGHQSLTYRKGKVRLRGIYLWLIP